MKLFRFLAAALAAASLIGCAPTVAQAQTAVVTNTTPTQGDCMSWLTATNVAGDSGIYCAPSELWVYDPGTSLPNGNSGIQILSSLFGNGQPYIINKTSGKPIQLQRGPPTTATDGYDFYVTRTANYTTAPPWTGYVDSAMRLLDTVSAGTGPAYEWTLTSIMDNSSTATDDSENVAIYGQGLKRAGAGKTWAGVMEIKDYNTNPNASTIGTEFDINATGTDTSQQRVINDLFCGSVDGNAATCSWGFRINATVNPNSSINTVTTGIRLNGQFGNGIDLTNMTFATGTGAAIIMGDTHTLCWDTLCQKTMAHNGDLKYTTPSGLALDVSDAGALSVLSTISTPGSYVMGSGQKLCLDGAGCAHWLTYAAGSPNVTKFGNSSITSMTLDDAGNLGVAGSLSTFGGVSGSGVTVPANGKICLDGSACANYLMWDGTANNFSYLHAGTKEMSVDYTGNFAAAAGISSFGAISAGGALSGASLGVGSGAIVGGPATVASVTSSGNVAIPTNSFFCFDGGSPCNHVMTWDGTNWNLKVGSTTEVQFTASGVVNAIGLSAGSGAIAGGSLNLGTGGATVGAISSTSETSSGNVQGATVTTTGNLVMPTNGKLCFNGSACTMYMTYNGTSVVFYNGTQAEGAVNMNTGNVASGGATPGGGFTFSLSAGVSCTGAPTSSFSSQGGIVTHC